MFKSPYIFADCATRNAIAGGLIYHVAEGQDARLKCLKYSTRQLVKHFTDKINLFPGHEKMLLIHRKFRALNNP